MADVLAMDGATERGPFLLSGLRSAAFPDAAHPGALMYLPERIDPGALAVMIYLHGHENCAENVVRSRPGPCVPGGEAAPAADLLGHLERSGRRALLLVPEVRFFARSSDPGAMGRPGSLRSLLDEVLPALPQTRGAGADDVSHVAVFSHSGGFRAAASLAVQGGVEVQELYLLDSLYGDEEIFDRFVSAAPAEFAPGGRRRLCNLYGESTAGRSRDMAHRLRAVLRQAGLSPEVLESDDRADEPSDEQLGARLLFKRVPAAHSQIPITYVGRLLGAGDLPVG